MHALALPLNFRPVYHTTVWGGRRMSAWRQNLPAGPIGESWDLSDHPRGMSVVADGALAGKTLRDLTSEYGRALVGDTHDGGDFPLLIKLIDANDRLSVQVHPDDRLAQELGVGTRGKTECWLMLGDGGELYVGTTPGCTRERFATALSAGRVANELNHIVNAHDGDFFFLNARTVHALGKGCLLYEVQQTCDITFRVDDWGRVGLDGKPRQLHVRESLATIDYSAHGGRTNGTAVAHPAGGSVRYLARCPYFTIEERRASSTSGGGNDRCTIVMCISSHGYLSTAAGAIAMEPMQTYLVPAAAGAWNVRSSSGELRFLLAQPGG